MVFGVQDAELHQRDVRRVIDADRRLARISVGTIPLDRRTCRIVWPLIECQVGNGQITSATNVQNRVGIRVSPQEPWGGSWCSKKRYRSMYVCEIDKAGSAPAAVDHRRKSDVCDSAAAHRGDTVGKRGQIRDVTCRAGRRHVRRWGYVANRSIQRAWLDCLRQVSRLGWVSYADRTNIDRIGAGGSVRSSIQS